MSSKTFGSLFAGVGGFDMGFEQAGWECNFQVEWDKHCQNILAKHWPDVPRWGDVSEVNGAELPPVDCIIFGSPCQDLSVAGKRAGLDGARSGLFYQAMRIIKEMRDATGNAFPKWIVWENVAGALTSNKGADFGAVLDEMAEAGALVIEWALLDAQYFGVPQRRRRVFVVACLDPATAEGCPEPLLPVSESLLGNSKKGGKKGKGSSRKTQDSLDFNSDERVTGYRMRGFGDYASDDTASAIKARDYKDATDLVVNSSAIFTKTKRAQSSEDFETWVEDDVAPTLNSFDSSMPRTTVAVVDSVLSFDTQFGSNADVFEDKTPPLKASQQPPSVQTVAYSIREDAKANTFSATELDHSNALSAVWPSPQSHHAQMFIVSYDGMNQKVEESDVHRTLRVGRDSGDFIATDPYTETMVVRRLTPIECERLMGWPDDHTRWGANGKEQSDTNRYKQCGNGVATPVAKWIADQIYLADHNIKHAIIMAEDLRKDI